MCQKRSGRPRSTVSRRPLRTTQRKGDVVAEPRERTVLAAAEQVDQRREEIAAAGEPAEEEVQHDEPLPVRAAR